MESWLNYYQHLPERINPIAFHIGSFGASWYSLMYIAAFLTVYLLLLWRIKNREFPEKLEAESYKLKAIIEEFIFYSFFGLLIGARLGYVLFYNLPYYLANPWTIISPFAATGKFIGIYGMSYHGGLIGVILATWYFCKKNKVNFWQWADFVIPAIPAGFFFGRIGNFLNGELYGRITTRPWGMYFSADPLNLRHPSQFYEAILEGLVLFLILWLLRNKPSIVSGKLLVFYIFLYGLFRIFCEFFREPDPQIGFVLKYFTLGQIFSAGMIILALFIGIPCWCKKVYNGKEDNK